MTQQSVIDIGAQAALIAMKIAAPALLAIMVAGLLISLLQAATQINEQTLSFIPKILAMSAAIFFTGPWILQTLIFYTSDLIKRIPSITH